MRPSPTLPSHASPDLIGESPRLNPLGLVSLLLLAAILFSGPCILGAVRPWVELPILTVVAVLLLLQAVRLFQPPRLGSLRQIDAIDLSVLLFSGYAILRWLTSPTEFFSRFEVLSVIGYAVVFIFCRYGMARRTHGVALIILLAGLGAGEVVFGYLLHLHSNLGDPASLWFPFGPNEQMHLYWLPRWVGTYGCPNHYAFLLVMAAAGSLAIGCFSRFPWPARIVFFYLAAVVLVGILYSQSRGSWLSLLGVVAALVYFAIRYGTMRWWIPLSGGVVLLAALAAIFSSSVMVQRRVEEVRQFVQQGTLSQYTRVVLTRDALRIARDHPLFGTGPATFAFVDPRYEGSHMQTLAVFTHDDYLNCLDDYGLVGFGLAMFFVAAVTIALATRIHSKSRWTERLLVAAALMAWCAILIHSVLDFNLHIPANAMMLFALTGMALSRKRDEDAHFHWSTVSLARLGPALGVALGIFGLLYGTQVVRTLLTDLPYENAAENANTSPTIQSIEQVQKSLGFDSGNVQALMLLGDLRQVRAARAGDPAEQAAEGNAALAAYELALRGNPLDDTITARMGMTYDILQRYSEAYLCYQVALKAQPFNGRFWVALGNHFFKRGLVGKAEFAYARAASCLNGSRGAEELARRMHTLLTLPRLLPPSEMPGPLPSAAAVDHAAPAAERVTVPVPASGPENAPAVEVTVAPATPHESVSTNSPTATSPASAPPAPPPTPTSAADSGDAP